MKHTHTWAPALALGLVALLGTGTASAHIKLRSPTPRDPNNPLKSAPCGPDKSTRGSSMTMLTSGQQITVSWDETIQHPGHYRIAFDSDGQDFPDPMSFTDIATANKDLGNGVTVLLDGIMDKEGGRVGNTPYTAEVTLPDIECTNCTLQLIQVMTDKSPYGNGDDIYHECANLVLKKAGGAAAGSGAAGAAAGTGAVSGSGASGGAAVAGAAASGTTGKGAAGSSVAGAPPTSAAGSTASAAGSGVAGSVASAGTLGSTQAPVAAAGTAAAAGALAPAPAGAAGDSSCVVVSAGAKRDYGIRSAALAVAAVALVLRRRRRKH